MLQDMLSAVEAQEGDSWRRVIRVPEPPPPLPPLVLLDSDARQLSASPRSTFAALEPHAAAVPDMQQGQQYGAGSAPCSPPLAIVSSRSVPSSPVTVKHESLVGPPRSLPPIIARSFEVEQSLAPRSPGESDQ